MIVIPGSNSTKLAARIAQASGCRVAEAHAKKFQDGETYIRIDNELAGENAIIVQTCYPNQNDSLMEIMLLADAAIRKGAQNLSAVIPYLAYSRQDKVFQNGGASSLEVVMKLLRTSGISFLITADAHFHRKAGKFTLHGMDGVNVSAARILLDSLSGKIGEAIVIGPDMGSSEMIQYATGKSLFMTKNKVCPDCGKPETECRCPGRKKEYAVSEIRSDVNFKDKRVIIMDDMIASGSTMVKAVDKVRAEGAKSIAVAATHGLFNGNSLEILRNKTDAVVVSDSIETPVSSVSISSLIAEEINRRVMA
ncbi:MAG: ribose-phosphate pyrophosphokinase [Candidatus Aenigmarchaeota archaeon]|nr:ribose-phosphate pyrophosphokinase [Candidatus Aenigmarchaeota archaeon]